MNMQARLTANLLELADRYARSMGLMYSTVSMRSYREAHFFDDLREGKRSFTVKKYDQLCTWFSHHWPDDVPWPEGIERPARKKNGRSRAA